MISLQGKDYFNTHLNDIFEKSKDQGFGGGKTIDAFAGVSSIYNHGNEPCLHISWLFNFSGNPWLTQKWTREICGEFYGNDPVHGYGYGQDEDQGQMGGWYVMTALGLFDVKGFTDYQPIVQFGSPFFDRVSIRLSNSKHLTINTRNNSSKDIYVQSATFNGSKLENSWMLRSKLMNGGNLNFVMGKEPNKKWGVKSLPPSNQ